MRQIWGGLLCLVVGLAFAVSGVGGGGDVAAGVVPCGSIIVGTPTQCPTGTITVTETSVGAATPPADWTVTVASANCPILDPTITVANGGSGVSSPLFVYLDTTSQIPCAYTLTETAVTGWTPTFDPAGPYSLADTPRGSDGITVALTNTSAAASATPTVTPTTSSSVVATATTSAPATARASATSSQLAATGTSTQVRWSLWLGIGLCVLGAVMVAAGWRRRGTHTG